MVEHAKLQVWKFLKTKVKWFNYAFNQGCTLLMDSLREQYMATVRCRQCLELGSIALKMAENKENRGGVVI